MGKTDWNGNEPELEAAKTIVMSLLTKSGYFPEGLSFDAAAKYVTGLYTDTDKINEGHEASVFNTLAGFVRHLYLFGDNEKYIREEDVMDTSRMSRKAYDNFRAWVTTLPLHLRISANLYSPVAEYIKSKIILGLEYELMSGLIIGDANRDGKVTVRDCAKIANALAFMTVDELPSKFCADYNQDDKITVRDVALLAHDLANK